MEWGKEIPIVDGERPAWLEDSDICCVLSSGKWCGFGQEIRANNWCWHRGVTAMRLPINHPHYKEENMTSEIPAKLVERMVAHFRRVEEKYRHVKPAAAGNFNDELKEARAIAKALPTPPDPEKEICRGILRAGDWDVSCDKHDGDEDWIGPKYASGLALACLRAGRDMERGK